MLSNLTLTTAQRRRVIAALATLHVLIIIASNYLVQLPMTLFGLHTTWGAFSFPLVYVATDLTARVLGAPAARRVVRWVMLPALVLSYAISVLFHDGAFAGWSSLGSFDMFVFRIALASFIAYAFGQMLDIFVFSRLRTTLAGSRHWWIAPAASSVVGNLLDSVLFFSIAFYASSDPFMATHWVEIATVDYAVKLIMAGLGIVPMYGLLLSLLARVLPQAGAQPAAA